MEKEDSVSASIRSFITKKFPAARKKALHDDLPLLRSGIVDSLGVLDIVTFLEHAFTIKISDDELTPDNFASIRCLASFVETKTGPVRISAE
jgi:acyl carrier protein